VVLRGSCTLAVGGGEPIPLGPGDVAFLPWGAALAGRVGYASEYASAHAFKREHGIPPGAYRLRKG